tara:strand:- start:54 stop:755 length:702 start_codon:yes stop_codon:yes gene_type:complete
MKKFLIATVVLLGSISFANAEQFRVGVSVFGGKFEADGAKEIFSGDHSSNTTTTKVTKDVKDESENAEGAFALGSVFAEFAANDQLSLGVSYVPHSSSSETAENVQNIVAPVSLPTSTKKTNTVKVSFEDLVTVYALANVNENIYLKAGVLQVELITEENLATGGAYDNDTLEGFTVGIGYNMDLDDGMFVRAEVAHIEIDGTTLTNKNDTTKSVSADGINGLGAAISVGKSF